MTKASKQVYITHFIIYLLGAISLLWLIYLPINGIRFNWSLPISNYLLTTVLVLASAFVEILTRSSERLLLGKLSNRQLNELSNRQSLFALVFIFGFMVMSQDSGLSRAILATYGLSLFMWSTWMNRFGYRMLVRFYYSDRNKNFDFDKDIVKKFYLSVVQLFKRTL